MREVPYGPREVLMNAIRRILFNKTLCPFYFQYDFARVIAGEEEAAYSWAGANLLMGTLLPATNGGFGSAMPSNATYGTLDLGGASTQISFFVPSQDISEGLFKLQIGSQRHWNIYAVSYLQFGIVSARLRFVNDLITNTIATENAEKSSHQSEHGKDEDGKDNHDHDEKKDEKKGKDERKDGKDEKEKDKHRTLVAQESSKCSKKNPCNAATSCWFSGYSESTQYKDRNGTQYTYSVAGPKKPTSNQLSQCMEEVRPLLMKNINSFCDWVYDNQVHKS
jgi:hypothetical protein